MDRPISEAAWFWIGFSALVCLISLTLGAIAVHWLVKK